jgi:hypothetical protein
MHDARPKLLLLACSGHIARGVSDQSALLKRAAGWWAKYDPSTVLVLFAPPTGSAARSVMRREGEFPAL